MKTEKQEHLINDKSHSRAEALTDLPLTDEQADETKGGGGDDQVDAADYVVWRNCLGPISR